MQDTTQQTAGGKVLMHFSMSLDGFVAGPGHAMDWMVEDATNRPDLIEEYLETTGAVLGGRSRVAAAAAGAALLAGSACTRLGIFRAGVASAEDPHYTVEPQRARLDSRESAKVSP